MNPITRREFIVASGAVTAASFAAAAAQSAEATPALDYSQIRGFNYQPSYGGTLQYIWTGFDRAVWEREVPWSKRFGSNMLRVWLDWQAYFAIGDKMFDALDQALDVLAKNELRMMPVLFNRWNDARCPHGGVGDRDLILANFDKFWPYVDALMGRFGNDARVAIWDVCNEPQAPWNRFPEVNDVETKWLETAVSRMRSATKTPITVGTMGRENVERFAPFVDVISFHPYTNKAGDMEESCKVHEPIAAKFGKPLICTEACRGSFDDQERGRQARDDVETLEHHGIGWLLWQLCEGRFVTGNKERTDDNALHPGQGYMPFVLADATTRPGHEWLERK